MEKVPYFLQIAIAGMVGALVRSLVIHRGSILLWRRWEKEGVHGFDLGIIGSLIMGATVAVLVDQSPLTAFSWAITGSYLLEELIKIRTTGAVPFSKTPGEEKTDQGEDSDTDT